jgi:hypothetical protein
MSDLRCFRSIASHVLLTDEELGYSMNPIDQINPGGCTESEEQFLCRKCGLCCDGTMFKDVRLVDADIHFIETNRPGVVVEDEIRNYVQPCRYHIDNKCTVYTEWRPRTCSRYICNVLKRFKNNEITFAQANNMIDKALSHAKRVRGLIFPFVNDHRRGLSLLFDEYIATQSAPNPSIVLDYGALMHRLKRDFAKNKGKQETTSDSAENCKST